MNISGGAKAGRVCPTPDASNLAYLRSSTANSQVRSGWVLFPRLYGAETRGGPRLCSAGGEELLPRDPHGWTLRVRGCRGRIRYLRWAVAWFYCIIVLNGMAFYSASSLAVGHVWRSSAGIHSETGPAMCKSWAMDPGDRSPGAPGMVGSVTLRSFFTDDVYLYIPVP